MSSTFNPQRLSLAREKRGLTKIKLASLANITTRSLTGYETGETIPTRDTIYNLSTALKFPPEFFFSQEVERINVDAVSFRALSSMTAAQRNSALAAGTLAVELSKWIDERFTLPQSNLFDLRDYRPEDAAIEVRSQWGLGERPIANTIHLLEANGVRVFSLAEDSREVDAFSLWSDGLPFVFLNTGKSGERSRFDAMHELGHLVLHRHGGPEGRLAEHEADAFAAAMLMPRGDVLATAPRQPTLESLIAAKKRWTVALSAINHRLHAIGITSDWHYRTLCVQISERGYRRSEPEPCERESSQLLQKVFAALKEEGLSRTDVARSLCISITDLDSLIFGLIPLCSMDGGNRGGSRSAVPHLKRIK